MYEALLDEAHANGLTVIEKYPFLSPRIRGLCCDDTIAISAQVETEAERKGVLCEELTHALHSYGNILTDPQMERRTRERLGRKVKITQNDKKHSIEIFYDDNADMEALLTALCGSELFAEEE